MGHQAFINRLSRTLVVLFLLPSFISASLSGDDFSSGQGLVIFKNANAHSISNAQFLFEEKETEDLIEESQNIFEEYCFFSNTFLINRLFINLNLAYFATRAFGNTTNLPVYLAKKNLLI